MSYHSQAEIMECQLATATNFQIYKRLTRWLQVVLGVTVQTHLSFATRYTSAAWCSPFRFWDRIGGNVLWVVNQDTLSNKTMYASVFGGVSLMLPTNSDSNQCWMKRLNLAFCLKPLVGTLRAGWLLQALFSNVVHDYNHVHMTLCHLKISGLCAWGDQLGIVLN